MDMQKWIRETIPAGTRLVLAAGLVVLAGCSKSPQDQLLDAGRCVFAAIQLEDKTLYRAATARMQKVALVIRDQGGPGANDAAAAQVDQQVMAEMTAHKSLPAAMAMFKEWRDDSTCKDMLAEYRKAQP